jgi:hexosaminidase
VRVEQDPSQPVEGYELEVSSSSVRIAASSEAGVFYAFQTLWQLLAPAAGEDASSGQDTWLLPFVSVRDAPRFPYRGLHLDSARHFSMWRRSSATST